MSFDKYSEKVYIPPRRKTTPMNNEIRENMKTWKSVGMLVTAAKEMMDDLEDGIQTAEQIMRAFGAGENRPHCEDCKHNWGCTPFCHFAWNPNTDPGSPMREGFIPRDVYIGKTPCPHFKRAK